MTIVAQSSQCLIIFFRYHQSRSWHEPALFLKADGKTKRTKFKKLFHCCFNKEQQFLFFYLTHGSFLSGTASFRPYMKWAWKTLCVVIIDSPVLKKSASAANAQYAPVQAVLLTDHIWKKMVGNLDGVTITTFISSLAPQRWQFKMSEVFLLYLQSQVESYQRLKKWYS